MEGVVFLPFCLFGGVSLVQTFLHLQLKALRTSRFFRWRLPRSQGPFEDLAIELQSLELEPEGRQVKILINFMLNPTKK